MCYAWQNALSVCNSLLSTFTRNGISSQPHTIFPKSALRNTVTCNKGQCQRSQRSLGHRFQISPSVCLISSQPSSVWIHCWAASCIKNVEKFGNLITKILQQLDYLSWWSGISEMFATPDTSSRCDCQVVSKRLPKKTSFDEYNFATMWWAPFFRKMKSN
jgi:hypothetical protein